MRSETRLFRSPVLFVLALALTTACAAAPADTDEGGFSADIVMRDAGGTVHGAPARVLVAHGVVRLETPQAGAGYFLIDMAAGTSLFLQPARRIYTDARQSTPLTQIFVPLDPQAPCTAWQAAAALAASPDAQRTWQCEPVMPASRKDGALGYRLLVAGRGAGERWVDPRLRFPVKVRTTDGSTLTLEHIRAEAPPPASLRIPAGFERLDPHALIERIRHSDVWVEPPH